MNVYISMVNTARAASLQDVDGAWVMAVIATDSGETMCA